MLKRLTAALVIVAWTLMSVESAVGELRDGEVHHESSSVAAQHRAESAGGFGHEHGEESSHSHQDGEHQHNSAVDHCTHVHGVGMISTAALITVSQAEHAWDQPTPCGDRYTPAEVLPHPPRV